MDKMREEFEAWAINCDLCTFAVGYEYKYMTTEWAWRAWKASRAALCVKLPDGSLNGLEGDSFYGFMRGVEAVSACLDDAGVRHESA